MIVAFDVGNTETTIGLFDEHDALCAHWRVMSGGAMSAGKANSRNSSLRPNAFISSCELF